MYNWNHVTKWSFSVIVKKNSRITENRKYIHSQSCQKNSESESVKHISS